MEKEKIALVVTGDEKGQRVDKYLVERLSNKYSRSFIQKLISEGTVLANGTAVKPNHKVRAGDSVEVYIFRPKESYLKPEDIPLDIVYEDDHLLVINKPRGMVVHPAPGNYSGTLVNAILAHCKNLSGIGGVVKPGIVHRIDKGTSGLLVVAKDDQTHSGLAGQFKAKTAKRVYIALAKGVVQLDNGIIKLPIGRSAKDRKKMAVNFVESKYAVTRYRVLERYKDSTLLEITLGTGRTHQIRVHMSYIEHPLVGDEKYGTRSELIKGPALHAKSLGFIHPVTKKYIEFTSELPQDMKELISKRRL